MIINSSLALLSFPDGLSGFHAAQHIIMCSTVVVCCCLAMLRHVPPRLYASKLVVRSARSVYHFSNTRVLYALSPQQKRGLLAGVGRRGSFCCQHHNCAYVFCLFLFGSGQQQWCSYRCLAGPAITLCPYPLQLLDTTYLSCTSQLCVAHT